MNDVLPSQKKDSQCFKSVDKGNTADLLGLNKDRSHILEKEDEEVNFLSKINLTV